MLRLSMFCFLIVWNCAAAAQDGYDKPGKFKVEVIEFKDLQDAKRANRQVPLKVFYPDSPGAVPLAIFSHGGAGNWDSNLLQCQHLASHGYVVIAPVHIDSNLSRVLYYMSKAGGGKAYMEAVQQITIDAPAALERPKDISFAIDQAIHFNATDARLKGRIDATKIAVLGHSYGAYTTLVVCGAQPIPDHLVPKVEAEDRRLQGLADPRVSAGFALSPQGLGSTWFGKDSYATIQRPLMCISGTRDGQKAADGGAMPATARLDAFKLMPAKDKYFLWLENADHLGFSENPNIKEGPATHSEARPDMQRIARAMSVVFCDAYLKNDPAARRSLNETYASSLCGKLVPSLKWYGK